jgi:hypothetical protein
MFPRDTCCQKGESGMMDLIAQNLGRTGMPMSMDQQGYLAKKYDDN